MKKVEDAAIEQIRRMCDYELTAGSRGVISDSVDIVDIMKPVYNFKASEEDAPWKKKKESGKMEPSNEKTTEV
jgi:hypothetical protein